jgi:hypothetical protein
MATPVPALPFLTDEPPNEGGAVVESVFHHHSVKHASVFFGYVAVDLDEFAFAHISPNSQIFDVQYVGLSAIAG